MIAVYWLEWPPGGEGPPAAQYRVFEASQLTSALQCAEQLRGRRRQGEALSHVSIQSEDPRAVGQAGVSDPDAGYAHYKRRIDPAIPLGRPSGSDPPRE